MTMKSDAKLFENSQSKVHITPDYSFEVNNISKTPIQVNNKSNSNQQNGYNQYYKRDQFQYNQNKFNRNQMNQHYNQTKSNNDCEQCGKTGHNIDNCWWNPDNDLEPPKCDNCGGLGHFSSKCRKSKGQFNRFNRPQINHITTDSGPYCCIADIVDPKGIIMCKEKWIIETVKINNKEVKMIVDSASQISCISEEVWKELGSPEMMPVNYNGVGLGKTNFNIEGKIKANIELFNKKSEEEVHIVKGEVNIMGLPLLNKFGTTSPILSKYIQKRSFVDTPRISK